MNGPVQADGDRPQNSSAAVVRDIEIVNKKGLHARASAKFVQTAEQFDAAITVTRGHESVGGTSIMGLMMLAAGPGITITIQATGKEAAAAVDALCALVAARFGEEDFLFLRIVLVEEYGVMVFGAVALVHEHGGVAAVVEDHVRRAAAVPLEQLGGVVPVILQALALDGEHRNAGGRDRGGGMALGRIDVARHPAHVGAERGERLDQHRGLDRHVQRAGDAGALQRLLGPVFLARRHQARHLGLGQRDFLAAEFGERNILDDVVAGFGFRGHDGPMQHA
jgi:phosphocarrier protein